MSYPFKPELAAGNRMISLAMLHGRKGIKSPFILLEDDSLKHKENDGQSTCIEPVQQLFNGFSRGGRLRKFVLLNVSSENYDGKIIR